MKPFNLEAAKNGAKVITRDGKEARILCFDLKGDVYNICGAMEFAEEEEPHVWTDNGLFFEGESNCRDLLMAPIKKSAWINIYRYNQNSDRHPTQNLAKRAANISIIDTIEIEWEE